MAILNSNEVLRPFIRKTAGYIKTLLSSEHIEMNNGTTLEETVKEISDSVTAMGLHDYNVSKIVGYRNKKPVYKIIKQFPYTSYNLSVNGRLELKIPEVTGRTIISYHANLAAGYGCYELPFINNDYKIITWVRHMYNIPDYTFWYMNNGDDWTNFTLVIEVLYQ